MLVGTCMLSWFSCVWLLVTLRTIGWQAPWSTGFSRQEYWRILPCPPPGDLPDQGLNQCILCSLYQNTVIHLKFWYNIPFHLVFFPFHLYFFLGYMQKCYSSRTFTSLTSCNKIQTPYLLSCILTIRVCGLGVSGAWMHLVFLQGSVDCSQVTGFFSSVVISLQQSPKLP